MIFIGVVILFASLLVTAQSVWKTELNQTITGEFTTKTVLPLFLKPKIWAGAVLYGIATIIYFYLLTRYPFVKVQAVAVPTALIFSIITGVVVFKESFTPINLVGAIIIILGISLVIKK